MRVLETTVIELNVECERAQKPRFQVTEKLIQKSAQSMRKLGVSGSERKSRACTEGHDSRQDDVFHEVAGRA